jgi:chaperonin GroEL
MILCAGIDIVKRAVRIPCHTIAKNTGVDANEVVARVLQEKGDVGYDALHGKYVNMVEAGIIDPTKVRCGTKCQA